MIFLEKIKCQNIDGPITINIINDWYWISASWLACLPVLVIVSATDYRDGGLYCPIAII